jgi:hypothetical protein
MISSHQLNDHRIRPERVEIGDRKRKEETRNEKKAEKDKYRVPSIEKV